MRISTGLLACFFGLAVCGCNPGVFRAETEIRPDGSVRRAIYQPAEMTPSPAREDHLWHGTTYAPRIAHDKWQGTIAGLPGVAADKDHDYFAAWGEFANIDSLPETLVFDAPEGIADGTLQREYERTDYVLVSDHRWQETLTDTVTLDDMHQAREQLADLVIPLAEKTLQIALGEQYDTQPLVDWMRQEARPLVFEMTDAYFDLHARKASLLDEKQLVATFEPILKRHGLTVLDEHGAVRKIDAIAHAYVRQAIEQKLRRRNGQPAEPEVQLELLRWLSIEPTPDGMESSPRFDLAMKQAMAERFKDENGAEKAFEPLMARMLGVYGGDFGPAHRFHYEHRMPGTLVETSGELVSDDTTLWTFTAAQAYPFGYTMSCRSLEANTPLEEQLLGKSVLTDRRLKLAYVELVRKNEALLAIMRTCADDGSLARLKREYKLLLEAGDEGAAAFGQMLALLESQ